MRRIGIAFVISLFLLGVTGYLAVTLNPLSETAINTLVQTEGIKSQAELSTHLQVLIQKGVIWDYLNWKNILILIVVGIGAVTTTIAWTHMVFHKLFWAKFYEQPAIVIAVRRGIFVSLAIVGILITKLWAFDLYVYGLWIAFLVIVELVIWKVFQKVPEPDEVQEKTTFQLFIQKLRLIGSAIKSKFHKPDVKSWFFEDEDDA